MIAGPTVLLLLLQYIHGIGGSWYGCWLGAAAEMAMAMHTLVDTLVMLDLDDKHFPAVVDPPVALKQC